MRDLSDRHCVIGAGFSGLAAAAALKRHGIRYDQLEGTDHIGGNWSHGVYHTAHIVSSRRTTEYAEFPMPAEYPDFPSAKQMLAYLNDYVAHFGLREHIELGARVDMVAPADGDRWDVTFASGEVRRYGGVVVCNGHHWDQRWPDYPGTFDGQVLHSKQYKGPDVLRGKRVLVVGGGNSGCDIAVEAARFAQESHISLRRGYWFMPKTICGVPTVEYLRPWMPAWLQRSFVRVALRLVVGPYGRYGLQEPKHPIFSRHPTINSQLLYFLKHGKICAHRNIRKLLPGGVEFVDGKRLDVDLLVYATGYHVSIPFIAPEVIRWEDGFPDLIFGVFPQQHRNLYVLGIGQPRYGAGPVLSVGAELVARCIEVQPRLQRPLGQIMRALGRRPLRSYLMDPHRVIREARLGSLLLPWLPRIERWLGAPRPRRATRSVAHSASR